MAPLTSNCSFTDCVHPLFLTTVLDKVFSKLSLWHLKKCRLVCQTWASESSPHMRIKCKINLTLIQRKCTLRDVEVQTISYLCNSFVIEDDGLMSQAILQRLNSSVRYLELKNFPWSLSLLRQRLLPFLPCLEELRLPIHCLLPQTQSCSCLCAKGKKGSSAEVIEDASSISWMVPSLRSIIITLTLQDLKTYHHKYASISPLLELLRATPNLQEIYYPNVVQFTSPLDNPARLLFENIVAPDLLGLKNLTALKIDTFMSNGDLDLLQSAGFTLKSLQMTLTPDISCDNGLYPLLKSLDQLEILTLTFRDGFRLTSPFPRLKSLASASIIVWNGYLDYTRGIKKLKSLILVLLELDEDMILELSVFESEEDTFDRNNLVWYEDMNQLEIHAARHGTPSMIRKLIQMPAPITKLTMDNVNDKTLQTIYRAMPQLQELVILYGGFTDLGITGIPGKDKLVTNDLWEKDFFLLSLKKFPAITDLKCLRSLVLTGEVSDFALVFGVVKCKRLKFLEIIGRFNATASDRSLKKIADSLDLELLRVRNMRMMTSCGFRYVKEVFRGRELYLNV